MWLFEEEKVPPMGRDTYEYAPLKAALQETKRAQTGTMLMNKKGRACSPRGEAKRVHSETGGKMISDFLKAAFPWILIGLIAAVGCALIGRKKK